MEKGWKTKDFNTLELEYKIHICKRRGGCSRGKRILAAFINLTVSHCNLKVLQSIEGLETLKTAKFTINNFYLEGIQSNKFSCHNGKCNYSNHVQNLFQSDITSFLCKFFHALTIV